MTIQAPRHVWEAYAACLQQALEEARGEQEKRNRDICKGIKRLERAN